MTSPLDNKVGAISADAQYRSVLSHFPGDLAETLDLQRMFVLIDGILPFEACLYYQVLPLSLADNCLLLGMVNPEDSPAADYVRRIIAYHNYYPQPQPISSDALQASLSAYLHYTGSRTAQTSVQTSAQTSPPAGAAKQDSASAIREALPAGIANAEDESARRHRSAPRIRTEQKLDRNTQPTLVVDSPEDLSQELAPPRFRPIYAPSNTPPAAPAPPPELAQPEPAQAELAPQSPVQPASIAEPEGRSPENPFEPFLALDAPSDVAEAQVSEIPPSDAVFLGEDWSTASGTPAQQQEEWSPAPAIAPNIPLETLQDYLATFIDVEKPPQVPTQLMKPIPPLVIKLNHLNRPAETLATLPPSELLQELLGRVLVGGIGRLYFEHQLHYGRILWSQNGVLQSVIDRLDLRHFRGIIAELKQLAGLPLVPVEQPRQVEIERLHERTRLLLRFRFIPTEQGEETTLQILRGAALKFYQQQQIATLERDALRIARQLQTKLNEIRDRARLESGIVAAKLEVLPALSQIIKTIEEQVDSLQPEPADSLDDAPPE
jgi:type II secretory ATPase GspE/PulE/Tfp pilus assembly ATPase PilB-like protein